MKKIMCDQYLQDYVQVIPLLSGSLSVEIIEYNPFGEGEEADKWHFSQIMLELGKVKELRDQLNTWIEEKENV